MGSLLDENQTPQLDPASNDIESARKVAKVDDTHTHATDKCDFVESKGRNPKQPFAARFIQSFHSRRNPPHAQFNQLKTSLHDSIGNDTSRLNRDLKGRHMQMIAIGGAIGTGLFVGSGSALATGGPAALMIAFGLIGGMLFCVVHALGELAVLFPISGYLG